jgi:glucose-1-phosphate cytidylyltransferase
MKVVLLAGGFGSRLAEETVVKPKPMVEVGEQPILWHIMKSYSSHGFNEFYICLGYKGEVIKRYFLDYYSLSGSMTIDISNGGVKMHERACEDWTIHLMDTGLRTQNGGRVKRLGDQLADATFMVTYGDGVSNVDLADVLRFHRAHGKLATVTAVRPPARFGGLIFDRDLVAEFTEKSQIGEGWINGGFMVFEPAVLEYLSGDESTLEIDALERLAQDRQLAAYRHEGFWQCMDTVRDRKLLESLWNSGDAPWKNWA